MIHTTQVIVTDPKDAVSGYIGSNGPVFMFGDGYESRLEFHFSGLTDEQIREYCERAEDAWRHVRLQVGVEGRRAS